MTNIPPFTYKGTPLRTVTIDGEPWFVLADVARVLEIAEPGHGARRLQENDRDSVMVIDRMGRKKRATVVNESGLYDVVIDSRHPNARAFRRWITKVVIPAIRRSTLHRACDCS